MRRVTGPAAVAVAAILNSFAVFAQSAPPGPQNLQSAFRIGVPSLPVVHTDGTPLFSFRLSSEAGQPPSDTIGIGYSALASWNSAANGPTLAIGPNACKACTTGDHNLAFGNQALFSNTTGSHLTALGIDSLGLATTLASNVVAVGELSLHYATGAVNNTVTEGINTFINAQSVTGGVAIGHQAGEGNASQTWTSTDDTFVGFQAGQGINGTAHNSGLGFQVLHGLTTGTYNVGIGDTAGANITTGTFNIVAGASGVGSTLTTGSNNILLASNVFSGGTGAAIVVGVGAKGGSNDTIVGYFAGSATGKDNAANTAFGNFALHAATTGGNNTAMGASALAALTTAGNVTAVGYQVASVTCGTGSNILLLGTSNATDCATAAETNTVHIGAGGADVIKATGTNAPSTSATTVAGTLNISGGYAGSGGSAIPACVAALKGARAYVTDGAAAPAFLGTYTAAAGTVVAPVFCNGTVWVYG